MLAIIADATPKSPTILDCSSTGLHVYISFEVFTNADGQKLSLQCMYSDSFIFSSNNSSSD
jgi:hypothetical protein